MLRRRGEGAFVRPILGNETSRQLLELLKRAEGGTARQGERIRRRLVMNSNYDDEDEFDNNYNDERSTSVSFL